MDSDLASIFLLLPMFTTIAAVHIRAVGDVLKNY